MMTMSIMSMTMIIMIIMMMPARWSMDGSVQTASDQTVTVLCCSVTIVVRNCECAKWKEVQQIRDVCTV
jgi:hypothetical protein